MTNIQAFWVHEHSKMILVVRTPLVRVHHHRLTQTAEAFACARFFQIHAIAFLVLVLAFTVVLANHRSNFIFVDHRRAVAFEV